MTVAADRAEWTVTSGGQDWRVAWHPPPDPPPGTTHGSAAVCIVAGQVVLVSSDGTRWGLPGGRPEPGEDWLDTLHREVAEEACATVTGHRPPATAEAFASADSNRDLCLYGRTGVPRCGWTRGSRPTR